MEHESKPAETAPATPPAPPDDPQARARRCSAIIQRVLAEQGCRAVAYILPVEPVGAENSAALVRAAWGIVADPR